MKKSSAVDRILFAAMIVLLAVIAGCLFKIGRLGSTPSGFTAVLVETGYSMPYFPPCSPPFSPFET